MVCDLSVHMVLPLGHVGLLLGVYVRLGRHRTGESNGWVSVLTAPDPLISGHCVDDTGLPKLTVCGWS